MARAFVQVSAVVFKAKDIPIGKPIGQHVTGVKKR